MGELARTGSVTSKQAEDADARLTVASAQRNGPAAEALAKVRRLARPGREIQAAEARLAQAQAAGRHSWPSDRRLHDHRPDVGIVTHKAVRARRARRSRFGAVVTSRPARTVSTS